MCSEKLPTVGQFVRRFLAVMFLVLVGQRDCTDESVQIGRLWCREKKIWWDDFTGKKQLCARPLGGKHPTKMPLKHCRQALNERYCLFTYKYRKVMELVILKCSSWSWQLYYIMSVLALNKKNQKFNLYIILTQISEDVINDWKLFPPFCLLQF